MSSKYDNRVSIRLRENKLWYYSLFIELWLVERSQSFFPQSSDWKSKIMHAEKGKKTSVTLRNAWFAGVIPPFTALPSNVLSINCTWQKKYKRKRLLAVYHLSVATQKWFIKNYVQTSTRRSITLCSKQMWNYNYDNFLTGLLQMQRKCLRKKTAINCISVMKMRNTNVVLSY